MSKNERGREKRPFLFAAHCYCIFAPMKRVYPKGFYKSSAPAEAKSLKSSVIIPLGWVIVMWGVHLWSHFTNSVFSKYGIYPRTLSGLKGVLFSPFIHGDWSHLINNTYPMLFLGTGLFMFYRRAAYQVLLFGTVLTGLWVWAGARESFHIGASGVVYVLAAFVFFSGVFTRNKRMMGLSLITVFIYGSMIWGVFPLKDGVSWESHLFGGIAGLLLAFIYRQEGPVKKKYSWDYDGDYSPIPEEIWNPDFDGSDQKNENGNPEQSTVYVYSYKPGQTVEKKDEKGKNKE